MREEKLGFVVGIALLFGILFIVMSGFVREPRPKLSQPISYGPPTEASTLNYEDLMGLDPQTQQTIEERTRNNDLEFRVDHLEEQVRRLNQIILGIPSIRIGEPGPQGLAPETLKAPKPKATETLL